MNIFIKKNVSLLRHRSQISDMESQLVHLVNSFHAYAQQHPGASIEDFCRYHLAISSLDSQKSIIREDFSKNVLISITLGRLARFADMYTKKVLEHLPLSNTDDIVYLMILDRHDSPRKSELIQQGLSEFSTGVEIIRRLLHAGLVEELPDPEDRRSKRIRLTDTGRSLLYEIYPKMGAVADIVAGSLQEQEKDLLIQILGRLDGLHQEAYQTVKTKNLDETAGVFASMG